LKLKQLPGLKKRSSKKTMSGLPSFFQQRGKTVLDELADYELGGELDEEDDRNSAIDDAAFTDGYSGSDLELPSFFQPNTRDNNDSSLTIDSSSDSRFASSSDDVNLSNLLNNFSWPNKGMYFMRNIRSTASYFTVCVLTSFEILMLLQMALINRSNRWIQTQKQLA
jgi:hypothetical protein